MCDVPWHLSGWATSHVHSMPYYYAPYCIVSQARLADGERVWYFTVSGFVLLSQLSQDVVGKLSIFIVRGRN